MAKKIQHVWGLEIGQSALKALRCHLEGDEIVADTFDFVEYPKILSQPEAEPEMLVADALSQFISRNDLKGNIKIGISVPGQSGLAKFFKPPPVEVKKIGDIVKYEAKQQIPFDLNDVIWDYQQMEGAQIEDGYALESEVGLFAMKKEAVFRALKPFRDASLDIDLVQLAPMSIYNMIAHDSFAESMATITFDPDHPPKSSVVLSIGTDASDLIVTNGFRVWQRSIPIGGNHFTRQLTKDLKLTFAKAEHLKRNAMQADDPKLVFQAMRPVFNDMVTEIQRSLNFFKTLNKKSELESMFLMGNTAKLPGLQQFLNKNLGMDVEILDKYPKLTGSEVMGAQAFKENAAAFGVVYGMCLQLLARGPMRTNLLPRQLVIDRVVRMKKPWTVGALSLLMVGMVTNHAMQGTVLGTVDADLWKSAEGQVSSVATESDAEKTKDLQLKGKLKLYETVGKEVSTGATRRVKVLEIYNVIDAAKLRDENLVNKTPVELPYPQRKDFHIEKVEQKYFEGLDKWFTKPLKEQYLADKLVRAQLLAGNAAPVAPTTPAAPGTTPAAPGTTPAAPNAAPPATTAPVTTPATAATPAAAAAADPDPTGPGWVFEITGKHYFNGPENRGFEGDAHINKYMIEFLEKGSVMLPDKDGVMKEVTMKQLGIMRPIVRKATIDLNNRVPNPEYYRRMEELGITTQTAASGSSSKPAFGGPSAGGAGGSGAGMMSEGPSAPPPGTSGGGSTASANKPIVDENGKPIPKDFPAPVCNFVVQFAWKQEVNTIPGQAAAPVAAAPAAPPAAPAPAPDNDDD